MGRQKGNAERSKFKAASSANFEQNQTGFFTGFGQEQLDQDLDPRLRVAFRKSAKKDATTRIKACEEILGILEDKESDLTMTITAMLKAWPRYYSKSVSDPEPRVRSQSHNVTLRLLQLSGKQSAPYLKNIMPPLIYGTVDEYSISCTACTKGIELIFPDKLMQVVSHISSELVIYCSEMVLKKPEKGSIDSELEVNRLISQGLRCLARYNQTGKAPLDIVNLLDSKSFWKLSRHKESSIRAGFFELAVAKLKEDDASHISEWSKSVLSSLAENEPNCVRPLWAAVLLLLKKSKDDPTVFEAVNFLKAFVPGLWTVLRAGGFGCGTLIYPHMLPLIATIPSNLTGGPFYENFFSNYLEGMREIEAKVDLKAAVSALLECLEYGQVKEIISNSFEIVNDLLMECINGVSCAPIEAAKPLYNLMSKWKSSHPDFFKALMEAVQSCFESTISEFTRNPSEENAAKVKKCVELVKHMVNCDRPRGVVFNKTDNETTSEPSAAKLMDDMVMLIGILVSNSDRLEPEFALLQLEIIIILAKNATKDFKNAIFNYLHSEVLQGDSTSDTLSRNHELVAAWLLPKYNLSRKIAEKCIKETIVEVSTENGEEESAKEPETHQFRFSKPKTNIFDGLSNILVDLSRGSPSSCASILEKMAAEPEALAPLLKVLFQEISRSTDEKCLTIAEAFTMKLFKRPRNSVWKTCCGTILNFGHESLKNKLNLELECEISDVSQLDELTMLTEIRLYDPRAENVAVLPQIGSNLARVISTNWDFEDAKLSYLINTAYSKLPETFEVVIRCFVYELLKFFHTDVSTISYACCMRVFEKLKFLAHQTVDENDDEELFTVDENVLSFLRGVFDDLVIAFNLKNNISRKISPLVKIFGRLYVSSEKDCSSFDLCAKDLLLLVLIEKGLAILSLQPTQTTEEISKLVRDYFQPFSDFSVHSLEAFKAIRLSNESSVEILSYILFEINSSRPSGNESSTFLKNTSGEHFGKSEDELDIRVSEVLTSDDLDNQQETIAVLGKLSEDPSRLIGVLAQIIENGIENWQNNEHRNLAMLLDATVKYARADLTSEQWDFILCNVTSWLENLSSLDSLDLDGFCLLHETLSVLNTLTEFFNSPGALADPSLPADMLDTWKEFFNPQISGSILSIFFKLVAVKEAYPEVLLYSIMKSLSKGFSKIGLDELQQFQPTLKLSVDYSDVLPDEINSLVNHSFKFMTDDNLFIALTGYHILKLLIPKILALYDGKEKSPEPPRVYVENSLKIISQVDGSTDTNDVRACVLAVSICLEIIEVSGSPSHVHFFLDSDHCYRLLDQIWPLLPEDNIVPKEMMRIGGNTSIGCAEYNKQEWALLGVNEIAKRCPGAVRLWQKGLTNRSLQRHIQDYTQQNLSLQLVGRELKSVKAISGITCIPYVKSRSISASYTRDDLEVEIMITLPVDWPLSQPSIQGLKSVGVNASEWRLWLFQLEQALATGAGLASGLRKWSQNLHKRFDGLEECYICYSIIYGKGQQLPRLPCRTCGKKFHKECLYKWFSSSNNSTCPLCRSPMIFSQK